MWLSAQNQGERFENGPSMKMAACTSLSTKSNCKVSKVLVLWSLMNIFVRQP